MRLSRSLKLVKRRLPALALGLGAVTLIATPAAAVPEAATRQPENRRTPPRAPAPQTSSRATPSCGTPRRGRPWQAMPYALPAGRRCRARRRPGPRRPPPPTAVTCTSSCRAPAGRSGPTGTTRTPTPGPAGSPSPVTRRPPRHPRRPSTAGSHLFVQADQKVRTNRYSLDTGTWSGWSTIAGTTAASSAPAATVYGGQLHLFVRGRTARSAPTGTRWTPPPGPAGPPSPARPAPTRPRRPPSTAVTCTCSSGHQRQRAHQPVRAVHRHLVGLERRARHCGCDVGTRGHGLRRRAAPVRP